MNKLELSNFIEQTLHRSTADLRELETVKRRARNCKKEWLEELHQQAVRIRAEEPDFWNPGPGKAKTAHLYVDGEPVCCAPAGWWEKSFPDINQECEFDSIAQATKRKQELQKHIWWKRITLHVGECKAA